MANVYRVLVSIEVEASDEDDAVQVTMNEISDPTMTVESVVELLAFPTQESGS